ncbi:MAG TPA: hypothetical protein VNH18_32100, partial [Bryobacteraceae bacterium]|nr:hypothetical protein [Bryobacteraceae bacterium]
MRIAVDVRRIGDFGVGTHIRNLLNACAENRAPHEFLLICGSGDQKHFAGLPENFRTVIYERKDSERLDNFALPALIRKLGVDLTHIPMHRMPLFLP